MSLLRPVLPVPCQMKVAAAGVLVLDLNDKAFSFALSSDVTCGLIVHGLYHVEVCSLYTHLIEHFITNRGRILPNALYLLRRFFDIWPSFC